LARAPIREIRSRTDRPSACGIVVAALSLALLRRRVEDQLRGDNRDVRLVLDKRARQERDLRRSGGHGGKEQWRNRR
jgi:hypothetical protein